MSCSRIWYARSRCTTAEEAVVHPVAHRKLERGEEVVEQRLEEDRAKKELADLYDTRVDHPEFGRRLQAHGMEVIQHATKEEARSFCGCVARSTRTRTAGWPAP